MAYGASGVTGIHTHGDYDRCGHSRLTRVYGGSGVSDGECLCTCGPGHYVTVPSHKVFSEATLNNGGDITEGVPIVLSGLDIGDVTYNF